MNRILSVPQQFRIRVHIAALTMACMGLVAALLIGLGWVATTRQLVQDAGERAVRDTLLLREQIRLQLIPAQGALRQIGAGRLPLAADEATRLQALNVLLGELRANPLEAAIYVAYPNGDFLLGRPLRLASIRQRLNVPESAVYLVQTISHQPDGRSVGRFHFWVKTAGCSKARSGPTTSSIPAPAPGMRWRANIPAPPSCPIPTALPPRSAWVSP